MSCACERDHRPAPLNCDDHHVLPRAWQRAGNPGGLRTVMVDGEPLWAPRTVVLAPTCHRNVHFRLAARMHSIARELAAGKTDAEAVLATLPRHPSAEDRIAESAIDGWRAAGGALVDLTSRRLWGVS